MLPFFTLQNIHIDCLTVNYQKIGLEEAFHLLLQSIQIDNQLITSSHPVVIHPTLHSFQTRIGCSTDAIDPNSNFSKPVLEIRLEKMQQGSQTEHVRYFTILMQELDFVAEKHFLDILFQWYSPSSSCAHTPLHILLNN